MEMLIWVGSCSQPELLYGGSLRMNADRLRNLPPRHLKSQTKQLVLCASKKRARMGAGSLRFPCQIIQRGGNFHEDDAPYWFGGVSKDGTFNINKKRPSRVLGVRLFSNRVHPLDRHRPICITL
jgi:hypothetical protein